VKIFRVLAFVAAVIIVIAELKMFSIGRADAAPEPASVTTAAPGGGDKGPP
jgi:hypothetical protein